MLCEKCKKRKATSFLSQDGVTHNLCSICSRENVVRLENSTAYKDDGRLPCELDFFLADEGFCKFSAESLSSSAQRCPVCNSSPKDISRRGVGCAECFCTFESEPIFSIYPRPEISEDAILPSKFRLRLEIRKKIDELRQSIRLAVAEEDYELAAKIRDRIRSLQNEAV